MTYTHSDMRAPSGSMILPSLILGPLGFFLLAGALEIALKKDFLIGLAAMIPGAAILAFLVFCGLLQARASALWSWYCQTGVLPQPKTGGFLKGAGVGALLGFTALVIAIRLLTMPLDTPEETATTEGWMIFYIIYGSALFIPIVLGPALVLGWAKRAWDRTAIPSPLKNVSGPGGSEWER